MDALSAALNENDLARFDAEIRRNPAAARKPKHVLDAARTAQLVRKDAEGITPRAIGRSKGWAKVRTLFS